MLTKCAVANSTVADSTLANSTGSEEEVEVWPDQTKFGKQLDIEKNKRV